MKLSDLQEIEDVARSQLGKGGDWKLTSLHELAPSSSSPSSRGWCLLRFRRLSGSSNAQGTKRVLFLCEKTSAGWAAHRVVMTRGA